MSCRVVGLEAAQGRADPQGDLRVDGAGFPQFVQGPDVVPLREVAVGFADPVFRHGSTARPRPVTSSRSIWRNSLGLS